MAENNRVQQLEEKLRKRDHNIWRCADSNMWDQLKETELLTFNWLDHSKNYHEFNIDALKGKGKSSLKRWVSDLRKDDLIFVMGGNSFNGIAIAKSEYDVDGPVIELEDGIKRPAIKLQYLHKVDIPIHHDIKTHNNPATFADIDDYKFGLGEVLAFLNEEVPEAIEALEEFLNSEGVKLSKAKGYLKKFSEIADRHFSEQTDFLEPRYKYFQQFFKKEHIEQAEWSDFQEMGEKIHALATNNLALKRAFGDPNHDIEHYRKAFLYLTFGEGSLAERIDSMLNKKNEHKLKYLSESFYGELVGYIFPNEYVFYNRRDEEAMAFLELDISKKRGESFGNFFVRYNKEITPLIDLYKKIVGQRTQTSIQLELDQFFSWLYDNHIPKEIEAEEDVNSNGNDSNYWWLNANPDIWRLTDTEVGQEQFYSSHNSKNNKRQVYRNFENVQSGDLIIGYESTPVKQVKAILEVTEPLHTDDEEVEKFTFRLKQFTPNQPSWNELKAVPELGDCSVLNNNQGSLFSILKEEFQVIHDLAFKQAEDYESYTIQDALDEVFMEEKELQNILDLLEYKKNIILQGPPGTGKTFLAKRLAWLMIGAKDSNRVEMIQFHPSYSYEDFIQGYRPTEKHFKLKDGLFMRMCKQAKSDTDNDYFLIIDEINRGNLGKIFGELMMLIEKDKRGEDFTVKLPYQSEDESNFYIPKNLHLIGTMNTADRSLAMVDYALRRRFVFIDMMPKFGSRFKEYLKEQGVDDELIEIIVDRLEELNEIISKETALGEGFQIGHSYFCRTDGAGKEWFKRVIRYEIVPLLKEYWFDKQHKADELKGELLTL